MDEAVRRAFDVVLLDVERADLEALVEAECMRVRVEELPDLVDREADDTVLFDATLARFCDLADDPLTLLRFVGVLPFAWVLRELVFPLLLFI